jgi:hypothetical protein
VTSRQRLGQHGGARFAQSLSRQGLTDEYRLIVHPVALAILVTLIVASAAAGDASNRRVQILDACDPETFIAALGEGSCVRKGAVASPSTGSSIS